MATSTLNSRSPTIKRILKEAAELRNQPDPTLHAAPLETNFFEWHFTIQGPPSTPYSKGVYHGRIILPPTYPYRPPMFRFLTPSGRFEVNREICLSISGHHEETWQPAWGIRTALWALRAFMEGDAKGQVGGMEMPESERKRLAEESRSWRCHGCGGRSNEDVLRGEGGEGAENKSDQVIPEELKFGFRDQMDRNEDQSQDKSKSTEHDAASEPLQQSPPTSGSVAGHVPDASRPSVAEASPTRTTTTSQVPQLAPTPTRPAPSDGVPSWIDKAITGLVAALALMIIKKLIL